MVRMSDTYTKLFSSITASTIVSEPLATRWVWVTMLAAVKPDGCVYASVPGLARLANVSVAEVDAALSCFLAPDPHSRTKDHEGRRIEEVDGGWRLLNHAKYDSIRNQAERAEYKRNWDREHRASGWRRAKKNADSPTQSDSPTTIRQESDSPAPSASSSTSKEGIASQSKVRRAIDLPGWLPSEAWVDWHAFRNSRKGWTRRAQELSLRTLAKLRAEGHDPRAVIEQSIERGWSGLFPATENSDRTLSAVERVEAAIKGRRQSESAADRVARINAEAEQRDGVIMEGKFSNRRGMSIADQAAERALEISRRTGLSLD
jgi:hypothetical protein